MNPLTRHLRLIVRQPALSKALMSTVAYSQTAPRMAMPPGFDAKAAQPTGPSVTECRPPPSTKQAPFKSMPPGFKAQAAQLDTFKLPERATGSIGDYLLGKALIDAWRRDGIVQIAMTDQEKKLWKEAKAESRKFFKRPYHEKAACVDTQSFAGYIASGEEVTDGVADYSEIFTITKDLDSSDPRVRARWPCHGPCPWPDASMKKSMTEYNEALGLEGDKLLELMEMGLGVAPGSLTRYTRDGWHHTRVLR